MTHLLSWWLLVWAIYLFAFIGYGLIYDMQYAIITTQQWLSSETQQTSLPMAWQQAILNIDNTIINAIDTVKQGIVRAGAWLFGAIESDSSPLLSQENIQKVSAPIAGMQLGSDFSNSFVIIINITALMIIRLSLLVMTLPILFTLFTVTVTEGLIQRDLRRFQGGRETAFLFHRYKGWLKIVFVLSWLIYLANPLPIPILYRVLPFYGLLTLVAAQTIAHFKKYI